MPVVEAQAELGPLRRRKLRAKTAALVTDENRAITLENAYSQEYGVLGRTRAAKAQAPRPMRLCAFAVMVIAKPERPPSEFFRRRSFFV